MTTMRGRHMEKVLIRLMVMVEMGRAVLRYMLDSQLLSA